MKTKFKNFENVDEASRLSDLYIYPANENLKEFIKPTIYSYDDDLLSTGPFLVQHLATFKLSLRMGAEAVKKRLSVFLANTKNNEYSSVCSLTVDGGYLKIFSGDLKDVLDCLPLHTIRVPSDTNDYGNIFYFLVYSDPSWCDLYTFKASSISEAKKTVDFIRNAVNDNIANFTLNHSQVMSASEFCGHSVDDDIACFTSHSLLAILFRTHFARLESFVFKLRCSNLKLKKSQSNIRRRINQSLQNITRGIIRYKSFADINKDMQISEFLLSFEQCKICFELVAYCSPSSSFGLISDTDRLLVRILYNHLEYLIAYARNFNILKDTTVKVKHPTFTERTRKLLVNTLCPKERRTFYEIGWSQIIGDNEGIASLLARKKDDICDSNCQGDFCAFLLRLCCGLKFSEVNCDPSKDKFFKDSFAQTTDEENMTSVFCKQEKKAKQAPHVKEGDKVNIVTVAKQHKASNDKELNTKVGETVKLLKSGKRWCKIENAQKKIGFVPFTSLNI